MITIPIEVKESDNDSCKVSVKLVKKSKNATEQESKTALVVRTEVVKAINNLKENK